MSFDDTRVQLELITAITTKFIDWKYEAEWRQIKVNKTTYKQLRGSDGFIADSRLRVSTVIFGINTPAEIRKAVRDVFAEARFLNCQLDYGSYEIVPLG